PAYSRAPGLVRLQNFPAVSDATVLKFEGPWRARLPVAFGRDAEPVFPDRLRIGQRRPPLFRRRANIGDVDELRLAASDFTHPVPPALFLDRPAPASASVRICRSSDPRS